MSYRSQWWVVAAVAGIAAACSSISANSDYDQSYDFSTLHNYAWAEISGDKQQADQISLKRVMDATDQALVSKGFTKTEPSQASFLVAIQTGKQQEQQYTTYGMGAWRAGGMSTTTEQTYDEGTLIIDIVDAQKKQLVWRGSANGTLDPSASTQKKTENTNEAVSKILANFPPQKGS
jgi:Domain of unknown function (DUF4136)